MSRAHRAAACGRRSRIRPRLTQDRRLLGAALGIAAFAVYMVGSGRPFGYDESASFAYGVATPDFFDAFGGSLHGPYSVPYVLGTNDHVLISLIGHAIYSLTHLRIEWVYRMFPITCAAAAVGVTAAALRARFNLVASAVGALFVATVPLFVDNVRVMRGYGPAVLLCLLATLVLLRRRRTTSGILAYAALVVLGMAAHIVAVAAVPVQLALVLALDRRPDWRLYAVAGGAALAGGLVNGAAIWGSVHSGHVPPRFFQPSFVPLLPLYLLGGTALVSLGIWLTAFLLAIALPARQSVVWAGIGATFVVVVVATFVIQPPYLYPRFFLFLLPGAAYCIAAAVQRWPVIFIPLAAVAIGYASWSEAPTYLIPEFPIKQASAIIDAVHARGGTACLLPPDNNTMPAYTTNYLLVERTAELSTCEVVLLPGADADPTLKAAALAEFPSHRTLPAEIPGYVLWRSGSPPPGLSS